MLNSAVLAWLQRWNLTVIIKLLLLWHKQWVTTWGTASTTSSPNISDFGKRVLESPYLFIFYAATSEYKALQGRIADDDDDDNELGVGWKGSWSNTGTTSTLKIQLNMLLCYIHPVFLYHIISNIFWHTMNHQEGDKHKGTFLRVCNHTGEHYICISLYKGYSSIIHSFCWQQSTVSIHCVHSSSTLDILSLQEGTFKQKLMTPHRYNFYAFIIFRQGIPTVFWSNN